MTVHQFNKSPIQRQVANGGEPPYDDDMEKRVEKLEELAAKTMDRLTDLERDVAIIKSNYATKADLSEAKNSIIKWVVTAVLFAQVLPGLLKKFGL